MKNLKFKINREKKEKSREEYFGQSLNLPPFFHKGKQYIFKNILEPFFKQMT